MIRRALISVSDKTGLLPLARRLAEKGVEILSTGGTQRALADAGVPVIGVEAYTGSPEVMDGRVKTLHPRVHGGILMRGAIDDEDLARLGGAPIDLVVCNLYPFEATVRKPGVTHPEIIENIDIGGPSMVRSAAKNHARVAVVVDPADYDAVLAEIDRQGEVSSATRRRLATKAFAHTAAYDGMVSGYLSSLPEEGEPSAAEREAYPRFLTLALERAYPLRYGENPHQSGAFYRERGAAAGSLALAESLGAGGKELSFNNLVDVDAAFEAVREFTQPAAVVVKHTNPCGVATGDSLAAAYRTARDADAVSAFGGIVALNREVDRAAAEVLVETFLECVVAPAYTPDALEVLRTKKNLRLLATGALLPADHRELTFKRVGGGLVVQERDASAAGEVRGGRVVAKRAPTEEEIEALDLGWRVCKHVKSNAIVLAIPGRTVGIGAGQMSRVESVRIACSKAGERARGSVLASDAFFPFPDNVVLAAEHGITAVAQPGGSVKDAEVIAAADAAGIAMVFTGARHFRH
ncbi:IMP cyclohydrolase [Sorangium cellulosum So ce56]|uniref:Bifunctional purine biosynthesis protein PurH n=1 Tax=Sorangium cellulosum (strain So ce56) TaxID=448385 RepID=PUR9_SORC5|nr:bifunctional phosphoribosylaminoimidazolecarboxamide formyltransferase/IMP cyclohydrolase [Sorangium cellulosum]A9GIT1.1 RecName: Full=Bifunctional purine biosynthesis protein PurH; Includes: RecName: Full=Phosphoribosylaminoimidazolecarboxamide formyltransferase; AltName: Full=AICAR transformylase; Includes: RecName: Full=IMP cyclohydrolase; AltName: Full=ATIC; AltName: Full=IMP synthase; AltName: Full=Inosinicase [Sorangium cellulosum So ce56]CAN93309.1 IMP cyclohydrolase [Sorangium cellulos